MNQERRTRGTGKVFWGIFLLLSAAFLVMSQMGFLQGIGVMSVLFSIFWVSVLLRGIFRRSFGQILFSIAFLCIIYDEPLGIEALTPVTVLLAALLGTIGLNLIFKRRSWNPYAADWREDWKESWREEEYNGKKKVIDLDVLGEEADQEEAESEDASRISFHNSFGAAVKYVNSDNFQFAELECSFGSMKVYFDNARVVGGEAEIRLGVSFGSIELFLPKEWYVMVQTDTPFGGVEEKNHSRPDGRTTVLLTGEITFSGVSILYV